MRGLLEPPAEIWSTLASLSDLHQQRVQDEHDRGVLDTDSSTSRRLSN